MSHVIEPIVCGGLLHSASSTVPHREQPQGVASRQPSERKNPHGSQLAAFAARTRPGRIGYRAFYGALAFWIVVAVLVAARVAFLDPSRIQPTTSLFETKAASTSTTTESASPRN
jgi:hypothetical protein